MTSNARPQYLIALMLLLLFEAVLSAAFYYGFTRNVPSANDFYVPWRATGALLREGRNPYSADVTRDIQLGLFGQTLPPDAHQFSFAYPLYTAFLIAPLAWLPYDIAQPIWLALLLSLIVGSGWLILRNLEIELKPLPLMAMAIWTVLFYPSARSLILGQLAVVVLACTVGAWWAARARREALAGVLLACTTIKPQMVFLWLPLALWWAMRERRFRLLKGFGATLGILFGLSMMLQPSWPLQFAQTASAYSGYFDSQSALQVLLMNDALAFAASLALALSLVIAAGRSAQPTCDDQLRVLLWAIIITQLIAAHSATTNQVLLLLPIFYGLSRAVHIVQSRIAILLLMAYCLLAPWLVFFATLRGDTESPLVLLPLSLGVAGWWLLDEGYRRARAQASLALHS